MKELRLRDLHPGQKARIRELKLEGSMRRRLLDMGLIEGTEVECLGVSPGGDPRAFLSRGIVIALRASDSGRIWVRPL